MPLAGNARHADPGARAVLAATSDSTRRPTRPRHAKPQRAAAKERVSHTVSKARTAAAPPAPVVVAVIDGGVDVTHPDLQGHLWVNPGEIPGNGIDDDGD